MSSTNPTPVSITITITETDTVVPTGETFASLQVAVIDSAGTAYTQTAVSTAPETYQATVPSIAPGTGSVTVTALAVDTTTLGTVLGPLPFTTTSSTPQTYPQATGVTVTTSPVR